MKLTRPLLVALLLGPFLIRRLRQFQIGQAIREEGPASHRSKQGTPTMGGLLVILAVVLQTLLWADLRSVHIWTAVAARWPPFWCSAARSRRARSLCSITPIASTS